MKKLIVITAFVLLGTLVNSANAGKDKDKTKIQQAAGKVRADAENLEDIQDVYGNIIAFTHTDKGIYIIELDEKVNCEEIPFGPPKPDGTFTMVQVSADAVATPTLSFSDGTINVIIAPWPFFTNPDGADCLPTTTLLFDVRDSNGDFTNATFDFVFVGRLDATE